MAVSVTLTGSGSIIAWQTPTGISFQRFNADHRPVGDVTSIATGPTVWLSAQALTNGAFSIVWDTSASATPTAQNYDANGVVSGSTYSIAMPPSADIAFSTRAMAATSASTVSTATTVLADGGYAIATVDRTGGGGNLMSTLVQRYDSAGNPVGSQYAYTSGLAGFSDPKVVPLADGGYAVSFIHDAGHSSTLNVLRFAADGTFIANITPVSFAGVAAFPTVEAHAVAALPNGGFVVTWTTSADDQMHAREFSAAGVAVGAEHVLGAATISQSATIDVFPNGDYVVSWSYASGVAYSTFTTAGTPVPHADNDLIATVAASYTLPVGPHDVTLIGNGAESVIGNALDNVITSNDFVSTLNGAAGNDTLITGHNANILTGGVGADIFKFLYLPWNNTGHVTDFTLGTDRLDFSALFAAAGYSGNDPIADGYVRLQSDGAGGTRVLFDSDGAGSGNPWPVLVTTLDNVSPTGITAAQLFDTSGGPSTPPSGGQTFTANDTRDQPLTGGSGDDIFYAGHNSVVITGGGGADRYVFQHVPWNNTGHITDFALGIDRLDFTALFAAVGYAGSDPVADGYIRFVPDGAGGTRVLFDTDGPGGNPWPSLVTTLDHISPVGLTAAELFSPGGTAPPPGSGQTLNGNNTRGQILTGGSGDDVFYAGRNSVVMTGGDGDDRYVFQHLPWNAGHITDFVSGSDLLDLRPLFSASGYSGTNPIGEGYLRFESDGADGTKVMFDPDGPATGNRWAFTIVTLDHVQPSGVHTGDWLYV